MRILTVCEEKTLRLSQEKLDRLVSDCEEAKTDSAYPELLTMNNK